MEFFVRLEKKNYGDAGWAVPALGLPGARAKRLLVDEGVGDLENDWVFEGGHLRKRDRKYSPSTDASLLVTLEKQLVTVWVPVIASVAAALIGALTTLAVNWRSLPIDPRQVQLCRDSLVTLKSAEWAHQSPEGKDEVARQLYDRCFLMIQGFESSKR